MPTSTDPRDIYKEMERDFKSIDQFNDLVRASALYYQQHGSLDFLKIFIPNNYLNRWSPEKAEEAANEVIRVFTKDMLMLSYLKETKEDGVYLAFPTTNSTFLGFARYLGMSSNIISEGRKKGIVITADEWLRDFPYERHAAWHNRPAISKEISWRLTEPENKLFAQALNDGQQNWLEREKYPKIEAWNPCGDFTVANVWKWKKTHEENQKCLEEFKAEYN